MYIFLKDCNLNSAFNYLLLSLLLYAFFFFVSGFLAKLASKYSKSKSDPEKKASTDENAASDVYEIVLNLLWKEKKIDYASYKSLPIVVILFIILNAASFISGGKVFEQIYLALIFETFPLLTMPVLFRAYTYYKDCRVWRFDQCKDCAAITDKFISENKEPIRVVIHYADDSSWAFLSGKSNDTNDGRVVSMEKIIKENPLLSILYVLPEGHRAELKNKKWFVSLEYS